MLSEKQKYERFAASFLDFLKEVDGFILKRGSPSSGFKNVKIYPKIEVQVYSFAGKSYIERALETNLA